jgi:hypothetical protein
MNIFKGRLTRTFPSLLASIYRLMLKIPDGSDLMAGWSSLVRPTIRSLAVFPGPRIGWDGAVFRSLARFLLCKFVRVRGDPR